MSVPAFLAAVQAKSADEARKALAPNFRGKANGRDLDAEGQLRLLNEFWTGFPGASFIFEPTGGSGRYVVKWSLSGTHDGVYIGVPPTGAAVAFAGFIIAVADKSGVLSLDWKWDPKVFTKAILGPDDIGTLEVKDTFRPDPSARWHRDEQRGRRPRTGKPKRKGKGKGEQKAPGRGPRQGSQTGTTDSVPATTESSAAGETPTPDATPAPSPQADEPSRTDASP